MWYAETKIAGESMKQTFGLSGAALKYIAMCSMLVDHVYKAVVLMRVPAGASQMVLLLCDMMAIFGRFAFPIFSFLLVEGFYHTRNKAKYLRNLLMFAILSEIPFNLMLAADWRLPAAQNVYFTWAIALGVIWLVDTIRQKTKYWVIAMLPVAAAGCALAMGLSVDYHMYGVMVPLVLYLLRDRPILASLAGYAVQYRSVWMLPSFLLTNLYNGQRGRQIKWLGYWFYPVHLLVLGVIRLVTGL